jgi:hypothetical protein
MYEERGTCHSCGLIPCATALPMDCRRAFCRKKKKSTYDSLNQDEQADYMALQRK